MSQTSSSTKSSPFMACGIIKTPELPELSEKIHSLGNNLRVVELKDYGYAFFTNPPYADMAIEDEMIGIKLGLVRYGDRLISVSTVLKHNLITPFSAQCNEIHGNALLICISKREPRFCAYKNLLAAPQLYYWVNGENIILTNNLAMMARLMNRPQLSPNALPQHFLYRSVTGRQTYLDNVHRLCPGEVLSWHEGTLKIELSHDLRALIPRTEYQNVDLKTANHFYEKFKWVMGVYLQEMNSDENHSAMLLSGGIDSPMMQLAVNDNNQSPARPRSFSYVLDVPSFAPEIQNAKEASRLLQTNHTFYEIPTLDYPALLVETIKILGQPPHHEHSPYIYALTKFISKQPDAANFLFCGVGADCLHGLFVGSEILRAEKYRNWPLPLLRFLGTVLQPIWQSKAYGAQRASEMAPYLEDLTSFQNPLNYWYAWTDWPLVNRCFGEKAICDALACRRELATMYAESTSLIEKMHMVILLSNDADTLGLWRQLGLANGEQIIFPYMDDQIIEASMVINPNERFFLNGRTKPVFKFLLEQKGFPGIANKPKFGSGFGDDLPDMMSKGVLRDMVQSIDRPSFIEKGDFEHKINNPDWFTMNMLTLDLFNKHVLA